MSCKKIRMSFSHTFKDTVGEIIIGAPKIRNNYGAIIHLSNIAIAILDFSLTIWLSFLLLLFASFLVLVL